MGSRASAPVAKAVGFDDLKIGIVGTGLMATAHAKAWSSLGMTVFIGSRDPAKATRLANSVGNNCVGGDHAAMLEASNFILLCIHAGPTSTGFIDTIKPLVMGKGKMFCDMALPAIAPI